MRGRQADEEILEWMEKAGERAVRGEKYQPDTSGLCELAEIDETTVHRVGDGGGVFGAIAQARHYEGRQEKLRYEEAMKKAVSSTVKTVAQLLAMAGPFMGLRIELSLTDPEDEKELGRESCVVGEERETEKKEAA